MGFTRYWSNVLPSAELAEAARKIVEASGEAIHGWDGTGAPELVADLISLNGSELLGESYETLRISHDPNWRGEVGSGFCKTNYRPYDKVVAAILIAAAVLNEEAVISRDGDFDEDDDEGVELYERAVGPLTTEMREKLSKM